MNRNIVISPDQSRAARALLNWTSNDLKEATKLGVNTVLRFERGQASLNMSTMQKLVAAFSEKGVEFPDDYSVRYVRPAQDTQQAA